MLLQMEASRNFCLNPAIMNCEELKLSFVFVSVQYHVGAAQLQHYLQYMQGTSSEKKN